MGSRAPYIRGTVEARFWAKVDKSGSCWVWLACRQKSGLKGRGGYGLFSAGRGWPKGAHVVSYELAHGPVPPGKKVLHTCDVRLCVRPDHLYAGTDKDNTRDMFARGRANLTVRSRGESHKKAKLTQAQVAAIRGLFGTGLSDGAIGRQFNVSGGLIRHIRIGMIWKQ